MPYINISENVRVDCFLEECNNEDIQNVIEWLKNNAKEFTDGGGELDDQLNKISLKRLQLTKEEEEIIYKRLV